MVVVGIHIGSVFEVVYVEAVDVFLCNLATRGSSLVAVDGSLVVLDLVKSVGLVVAEAVCLYVLERAVGLWLVFIGCDSYLYGLVFVFEAEVFEFYGLYILSCYFTAGRRCALIWWSR